MKLHQVLGLAAGLALLAGCGTNYGIVKGPSASNPNLSSLSSTEKSQINSLRTQDQSIIGGASAVRESSSANESAIYHTGFLASMTSAGQASAGGTVEETDNLPLATNTGALTQDPENRLSVRSGGSLPTVNDNVFEYYIEKADDYASTGGYVTDDNGDPSRVLTMWYSRIGRRILQRNQLSLYGFGSVPEAQSFDLRVPNPPNNTFLNGDFRGTFVLIYDTSLPRDTLGIWPRSSSQGGAFDVHQSSTDNNGTGCPISFHTTIQLVSLVSITLEIWDGTAFVAPATAAAMTLWASADITGATVETGVTLTFSQDTTYFNDEFCLVPNAPLPVGLYKLTVDIDIDGSGGPPVQSLLSGSSYFRIVP